MMNRRHFLQSAAAFSAFPILGADSGKVYRTALIGSGWWGMNILREALAGKRCKAVAICDVDKNRMDAVADEIAGMTGDAVKRYGDYRELLEKEKPEIVIIGTPDHWHALPAIAAMKAGAHVYVEKPTAHSINESRAMVKTARECGVVVQVGLHRRIGPHHVNAMKFLREGKLGKIGTVRLFVSSKGGKESPKANAEAPQGLDWDFYCGPAPLRKFNQKIHPGGWRNFLDFSNGQIGDWGVHWLDQALWWSEEKAPKRVFSTGGRPLSGAPVNTDAEMSGDAPEDQTAVFEFENFTAIWENRRYGDNNAEKHKLGAYFYGTEGTLHIGWRDGWTFYPANEKKPMVHEDSQLQEPDGHNIQLLWADFLEAIEKKRPATANLEAAHRSSVLPMLAMISLQTKSSLDWDGEKECITNNAAAQKLLRRNYRGPWVHPEV